MRHHMTKAIGLHLANEVWETVDRHLFRRCHQTADMALPRIGSWWNFTRIPGRARSHTKARPVWETWRLVGTLDGHLHAYRHPELPETVTTWCRRSHAAEWAPRSWPSQPGCRPRTNLLGRGWSTTGVSGRVYWPARRGCGVARPAPPGRGSVVASGAFSGRSRCAGTRSTWFRCKTATRQVGGGITRICSSHQLRLSISSHTRPPQCNSHGPPRRDRCECIQPFTGLVPQRAAPASRSSSRSRSPPSSRPRQRRLRDARARGSARWIGPGAPPTPTNTSDRPARSASR